MAKKTPSLNYVNFALWMVLIAIFCVTLLYIYNKTVFEKFEAVAEKKEEEKKEDISNMIKKMMVTAEKKKEEFDAKEQSLFEKIVKNEISSSDLEKLINAGVVTQNMVEKFLSKLDEKQENESPIEGFSCSGNNYGALL
jgi:dTDP-glucose pyrophosphorylase